MTRKKQPSNYVIKCQHFDDRLGEGLVEKMLCKKDKKKHSWNNNQIKMHPLPIAISRENPSRVTSSTAGVPNLWYALLLFLLFRSIMTFDALLANLRHASTNWWNVNKNKNLIKFSCGFYCYFNVYYSSE